LTEREREREARSYAYSVGIGDVGDDPLEASLERYRCGINVCNGLGSIDRSVVLNITT